MNSINTHQPTIQVYQPDSFEKGRLFEDYIIKLFNENSFKLLAWRHAKNSYNQILPLSYSYPDLELVFVGAKRHRFAVECKWRREFKGGRIKWAEDYQIRIYQQYEYKNRIPVFIAIGLGGEPSKPEKLFVTPLCNISEYPVVSESQLILYKRKPTNKFFYDTIQFKLF
jgi:hypothetical protein